MKITAVAEIQWMQALSYVYIQMHQYEKAKVLLEAALVLDDKNDQVLKSLSYIYYQLQNFEAALRKAQTWVQVTQETKPAHERAQMYLLQAQSLLRLDKKDLAKKCLEKHYQLSSPEISELSGRE